MKPSVLSGLENLKRIPREFIRGKRLGLLANPASLDRHFNHASGIINTIYPGQLKVLFSPQHGFYAEKQDNMIESGHLIEPHLNIPIYSLYSNTRWPDDAMMEPIDMLIIDLQNAGTRVYTFIYTISYCLEAAARLGKEVVILDRPNPVGGLGVEGNILSLDYASFVGRYPIPMRHGLTVGEISSFFNEKFNIGCSLRVIPMEGWQRAFFFRDTGLPWVPPSPNLPTPESAAVYPGQVIFEGTNISEGRGTTQPFELFGAPFIDSQRLLSKVEKRITGAVLRPVHFQPTSGKWKDETCHGFQLHVISREQFKPYQTSLILLQEIIKTYGDFFQWKAPPYEYEYEKLPMDLILGDGKLRTAIESMEPIESLEKSWENGLLEYKEITREYHLYE